MEVGKPTELNAEQTQTIKDHLNLVFKHEVPIARDKFFTDLSNFGSEKARKEYIGVETPDKGSVTDRDSNGVYTWLTYGPQGSC